VKAPEKLWDFSLLSPESWQRCIVVVVVISDNYYCSGRSLVVEKMSHELSLDDIITEFLLNTCQLCPPSRNNCAVAAKVYCGLHASGQPDEDDPDVVVIPLTTGSIAEFYIEPILPYIGDVDVMVHYNNMLAIPQRHPPPTQLPDEFHNYVKVFEIIGSHLPGYVYLELRYLLTQCSDDDNYNAVEYDRGQYASNQRLTEREIHGPAAVLPPSASISVDTVLCVRCLSWPSQAADWPTRHRNYGWPDSATLDCVVSNGCDVVHVAHRQCRQHEWMGMHQHRLSFSRAEIVLLNSWSPVQQIIYHMLRYFVKNERLTDCADSSGAKLLSNYHIKTLMLWASETKSSSWWTDSVNLVRTCVQLLHILADWLSYGHCPHYFINCGNLVDSSFNLTNIRDQLMSVDETLLSTWFAHNYIQKCLQLNDCPQNISRLFRDVTTSVKLQNAVSVLVAERQNRSLLYLLLLVDVVEFTIPLAVYVNPLTAQSCVSWMNQWTKIESHLSVYFRAVAFLHVASRLKHGLNNKLMDILATICGLQFADIRRNSYHSTSVLSVNIAGKLMKVVANKSLSTLSLIQIELSKAYLYRALKCKDSDSNSIYCLANVYLAVLYYTTGQNQMAIDHCTLVTKSQDHSQCSSHVVQGQMLPKFDVDIDNMLGLAELYQSIRTAALKQQRQPQLLSIITTESFAYYLHIKYLAVTNSCQFRQMLSSNKFKRYEVCINDSPQLFITDVLLFLSVSRLLALRCKSIWLNFECSFMNAKKCNTSDLVELLQKSAVEHLTTCRQLMAQDFSSLATIVTTDFEALYAFKCDDYQQCLRLSTQNVHMLLYADDMPNVSTFLEFIQLMDDDIVSLTALTLIVGSNCLENSYGSRISQLTLSLYLMTQCQLRLHHSVMSLAQTLVYIKVAQRRFPAATRRTLDQLTLKLTEHKLKVYVNALL